MNSLINKPSYRVRIGNHDVTLEILAFWELVRSEIHTNSSTFFMKFDLRHSLSMVYNIIRRSDWWIRKREKGQWETRMRDSEGEVEVVTCEPNAENRINELTNQTTTIISRAYLLCVRNYAFTWIIISYFLINSSYLLSLLSNILSTFLSSHR